MVFEKGQLKDLIFKNYDAYIKYASEFAISKYGLYPEDLVNEAIVGTIDCEVEFKNESEIKSFIERAIKNIFYNEHNISKKSGGDKFQEELNEGIIRITPNYVPAKIDELYDFFYELRFPTGLKCSKCGSHKIIEDRGKQVCGLCDTFISITNNTYLKKNKVPYSSLYKLAVSLSKADRINYKILLHDSGIKSINQLFKGRVQFMKKVMLQKNRNVLEILKALLTITENKIEKVSFKPKFGTTPHRSLNHTLNQLGNLEYLIHISNAKS